MASEIRLITTEADLARCAEVMLELRRHLTAEGFVKQGLIQLSEGYHLACLEEDGVVQALAGFRMQHMTVAGGKSVYVDDLVTSSKVRSTGQGAKLLRWVEDYCREQGCVRFTLDSGVDNARAHRFYFREGLRISAFHFSKSLTD
jgi:GNAT superfamily N-acetyltransferase